MASSILGIDDHIQACLAELHPIVSKYSYPLFAADGQDRPDLFASCVFIEINNIPYLVTAAHALHEIEKTGSKVHVGAAGIQEISEADIRSSQDGRDPLDIAAIAIDREFITAQDISVLTTDQTVTGRVFERPHMHCMHGYPCTKNKQFKAIDMQEKIFTAYAFTYAGTIPKELDYSKYKKDPRIHSALSYSVGKDNTKKRVTPPKGKGMSGGGLWIIPSSFNARSLFLKGLLIEQHGEIVFSTQIEHVLKFIEENA